MRVLISIVLFALAYLFLRGFVEDFPAWLSSLLAVLLVTAALVVCLYKSGEKAFRFQSLRRFGWLQVVFFSSLTCFVLALIHLVFWFGPAVAVDARNAAVTKIGLSAGKFEELGEAADVAGQGDDPEVLIGNDENTAVQIPKRGGPKGKKFPEVWIEPRDQKSKILLSKGPVYITLKNLLDLSLIHI